MNKNFKIAEILQTVRYLELEVIQEVNIERYLESCSGETLRVLSRFLVFPEGFSSPPTSFDILFHEEAEEIVRNFWWEGEGYQTEEVPDEEEESEEESTMCYE